MDSEDSVLDVFTGYTGSFSEVIQQYTRITMEKCLDKAEYEAYHPIKELELIEP